MEIVIIQRKIYELRGYRVILDYDLAEIYEVETTRINEQVKRNIDRFPANFMFRLTLEEWKSMRSQFATASTNKRNTEVTPYAFTEHGVAMLASVLRSDKAVKMNIAIVRAFIELRQFAINYDKLAKEIKELREITHSHNIHLNQIYNALEKLMVKKTAKENWADRDRIGFKPDK